MATIKSTDDTYKKLIEENKIIIFDFFGTWCSPCTALSPILDSIALEMKDKIVIAKHDIDSDPDFPTLSSVRGVPALYMYKDKKLVSQKVGMSNKADLVSWINQYI